MLATPGELLVKDGRIVQYQKLGQLLLFVRVFESQNGIRIDGSHECGPEDDRQVLMIHLVLDTVSSYP